MNKAYGFNKWKNQFGRHVKKGEKGLTIIAPTPFKKRIEEMKLDPDTRAPVLDHDGNVSVNLTGGELRGFVKNDVLGFAFQDVVAESPNVGEREVSFKIALSGDRANCYKVSLPKVNVKISKAVFDLESVKFNSKTLSYNGKNQSIFVEGEVPECLKN